MCGFHRNYIFKSIYYSSGKAAICRLSPFTCRPNRFSLVSNSIHRFCLFLFFWVQDSILFSYIVLIVSLLIQFVGLYIKCKMPTEYSTIWMICRLNVLLFFAKNLYRKTIKQKYAKCNLYSTHIHHASELIIPSFAL